MIDIIVTTPKSMSKTAAQEAEDMIKFDGGFYFRTLRTMPKQFGKGSKIFYVEDGFIRGYLVVDHIVNGQMTCGTTGKNYDGWQAVCDAASWKWIRPIAMKGFQGWRYYQYGYKTVVVGDWKAPKPDTKAFK